MTSCPAPPPDAMQDRPPALPLTTTAGGPQSTMRLVQVATEARVPRGCRSREGRARTPARKALPWATEVRRGRVAVALRIASPIRPCQPSQLRARRPMPVARQNLRAPRRAGVCSGCLRSSELEPRIAVPPSAVAPRPKRGPWRRTCPLEPKRRRQSSTAGTPSSPGPPPHGGRKERRPPRVPATRQARVRPRARRPVGRLPRWFGFSVSGCAGKGAHCTHLAVPVAGLDSSDDDEAEIQLRIFYKDRRPGSEPLFVGDIGVGPTMSIDAVKGVIFKMDTRGVIPRDEHVILRADDAILFGSDTVARCLEDGALVTLIVADSEHSCSEAASDERSLAPARPHPPRPAVCAGVIGAFTTAGAGSARPLTGLCISAPLSGKSHRSDGSRLDDDNGGCDGDADDDADDDGSPRSPWAHGQPKRARFRRPATPDTEGAPARPHAATSTRGPRLDTAARQLVAGGPASHEYVAPAGTWPARRASKHAAPLLAVTRGLRKGRLRGRPPRPGPRQTAGAASRLAVLRRALVSPASIASEWPRTPKTESRLAQALVPPRTTTAT